MSPALQHWEGVYRGKNEAQTSWFRPHLDASLRLIDALALAPQTPIVDVGGGRSTLVDDLIERGFGDVTVVDVAAAALDQARGRLGSRGAGVAWIADDIAAAPLGERRFGLWHDRAMFHFLVDAEARARYVALAARAVRPGGFAIVATFAPDGPERCSGLPVARYDADALAAQFAPAFRKVDAARDVHRTPWASEQPFTYVVLKRDPADAAIAPGA